MSSTVTPRLTRHPDGITAVDVEYVRHGLAASHIIEQNGRAAFVDVGTNYSAPYLLAALDELGIRRDAVDYICLTHVHLDHAGGAGCLLQSLPKARVVIHPRGVAHMVDPTKLIAASKVVYGEEPFQRLYGDLVPIPGDRVISVEDGQRLSLAGRELEFIHTPGHALHHYVIVDVAHANLFTGDTFGISYREFDTVNGAFIIPTTTPTQFDPEQFIASVDRMLSYSPKAAYLTHFSRVTDLLRLGESLKMQIREHAKFGQRHADAPNALAAIRADIRSRWLDLLRRHECPLSDAQIDEILEMDAELNAQGLVAWIQRQRTPPRTGAKAS